MVGAKAAKLDHQTESERAIVKTIIVSREASADLDRYCDYISQNNPDAGLKFFDATRSTFTSLAKMPLMGRLYAPNNPQLENLRRWRVKEFVSYLIFLSRDRGEH